MKKFILPAALLAATGAAALLHAGSAPDVRPSRPSDPEMLPPPPVVAVLDTNHDGMLSAAEIAAAPRSLLTLKAHGDGVLDCDELMAPPPRRPAAVTTRLLIHPGIIRIPPSLSLTTQPSPSHHHELLQQCRLVAERQCL